MSSKIKLSVLFLFMFFALSSQCFSQDATPEGSLPEEGMIFAEEMGEGVITGKVVSVDTASGNIAVTAPDGSQRAFSVVDGETILWKGIEDIELSSVQKDQEVEVGYYTNDSGQLIASWVDVLINE